MDRLPERLRRVSIAADDCQCQCQVLYRLESVAPELSSVARRRHRSLSAGTITIAQRDLARSLTAAQTIKRNDHDDGNERRKLEHTLRLTLVVRRKPSLNDFRGAFRRGEVTTSIAKSASDLNLITLDR